MSYGNSTARYLEADIMSRSPEWLVPLLYEHLLVSLKRAAVQIEIGDIEGKAESLSKAGDIVMELAVTLDREKGGEIAGHLASLYAFMAGEILAVGQSLDTTRLGRLSAIVAELHEAWEQAAEQVAPRGRAASGALTASA